MKLLGLTSPDMSQALWDRLNRAFPPIVPVPNVTSIEEIMFNAGQRGVIEWLGQFTRNSVITGEIDAS